MTLNTTRIGQNKIIILITIALDFEVVGNKTKEMNYSFLNLDAILFYTL